MPDPDAARQPRGRSLSIGDALAYAVAGGLAGCAAWFSLKGLAILFPGAPHEIIAMGACMEAAKLVACGWLAGAWRRVSWIFRGVLMLLIAGLAAINAAGTFSQLTAAHVGERGAAAAEVEMQDAALAAKVEVVAGKVADLDRQIAQIDGAVAAATQRGRTATAMSTMEGQRKTRAGLAGEREKAADALAALKAERAGVAAKGRQQKTEAAPIRYVAELLGADPDSEQAIRWLILLMVLTCDPLAIALTAAASARRA